MPVGWKTAQRLLDDDLLAGYSHTASHILLVLAHMENVADGAFPSERTLALKAHANRRTVRAVLNDAERRGLLSPDNKRRRGQIVYRFTTGASSCTNERPATGVAKCASETGATGALSASRLAQSEHATGALSLARKEPRESTTRNRGERARARRPRASDIGLSEEEIAERNRLDLAWKREQAAKSKPSHLRTAEQEAIVADFEARVARRQSSTPGADAEYPRRAGAWQRVYGASSVVGTTEPNAKGPHA
jgi:hypothetical protein